VALPLPILRSATEISRAGNRPVRPRPKPEFLGRLASARLPRSPSLARNDVQGRFVSLPGAKQACPRQGGGSNLLPPSQ